MTDLLTRLTGFDIETHGTEQEYGLQPWRHAVRDAQIKSFAYMDGGRKIVEPWPTRERLSQWLSAMASERRVLVGHKVMFDVAWLLAYGLETEVFECTWLDSMLLWKRVDAHRFTYGLKEAVRLFIPKLAGYEEDVDLFCTDGPEFKKLLKYNLMDAYATRHLAQRFLGDMDSAEIKSAMIEAKGIPDAAQSWLEGIELDRDVLKRLARTQLIEVRRALADLKAANGGVEVDEKVIASPTQLRTLLFDDWALTPVKKTDKGALSTDKETLLRLAVEDKRAASLLAVRSARNRLNKFVISPINSLKYHGNNTTHPEPKICGTYTGRMTYSSNQGRGKAQRQTGIALHQWERAKHVRESIIAPPGYMIAEFDFSGQEMRLMADRVAVLTGDTIMLDLFLDGKDMHSYMGAGIKNVDYDWLVDNKDDDDEAKQIRYLGKFANLSLQYRIGVPTMRSRALTQYGLWLDYVEATRIHQAYPSTYPGVAKYWAAAVEKAKREGYAVTMGHRRVMLPNMGEYKQQQTAINTPIQGTGADMKALALAVTAPIARANGGRFAWDLHDALFYYLPIGPKVDHTVRRIRDALNTLPYKKVWGWEPTLPLPVDCTVGTKWGHLKPLED